MMETIKEISSRQQCPVQKEEWSKNGVANSRLSFLYNSLAKTYSVYVNKVLKLSDIVTVADTQDTNGFGLFGVIRNTDVVNKGTKELSNFKVHKKLLTDKEIQAL